MRLKKRNERGESDFIMGKQQKPRIWLKEQVINLEKETKRGYYSV